jgi:hypothetical protein
LAALLIAPSQPWSAAGPEKPMTTFLPGESLSLAARGAVLAALSVSGSLLVQPAATSPTRPTAAMRRKALREVVRDMVGSSCGCGVG